MRAVETGLYVAMDGDGKLYGEVRYSQKVKSKEVIEISQTRYALQCLFGMVSYICRHRICVVTKKSDFVSWRITLSNDDMIT